MADPAKTQAGLATAGGIGASVGPLLMFIPVVGPVLGGAVAIIGAGLTFASAAMNPAATAARKVWEARGFSHTFADEYGKWFQRPESDVRAEMEKVAGKLAETGDAEYGHQLQALGTILRERAALSRPPPSTGTEVWAGLALLGILTAGGLVLFALRRR
jgi:LPXTG-motif cell wall-anchored protein